MGHLYSLIGNGTFLFLPLPCTKIPVKQTTDPKKVRLQYEEVEET
jgi:hypothetical protein